MLLVLSYFFFLMVTTIDKKKYNRHFFEKLYLSNYCMRCSWKSTGRWRRARRRAAGVAAARAGTSTATNSPRTRWRNSLRTSSNQPTFRGLQTQCIMIFHRKHRQLLQLEVVCIHYEPLAWPLSGSFC